MNKQKPVQPTNQVIHGESPEPTPAPHKPDPKRRGIDPELQAMARLDRLMSDLHPGSIPRVLKWLVDRWTNVYDAEETHADPTRGLNGKDDDPKPGM